MEAYGALTTGVATVVLAIVTFFYLRETREQRRLTRSILESENSHITIELGPDTLDRSTELLKFEISLKNIGPKPAYGIEFKFLTRRSPRECVSRIVSPGSRAEYEQAQKNGIVTYRQDTDVLTGRDNVGFYCEIWEEFLDYDSSFYLWVRYRDFYRDRRDEIRLISLARRDSISITNANAIREQVNKKFEVPVNF